MDQKSEFIWITDSVKKATLQVTSCFYGEIQRWRPWHDLHQSSRCWKTAISWYRTPVSRRMGLQVTPGELRRHGLNLNCRLSGNTIVATESLVRRKQSTVYTVVQVENTKHCPAACKDSLNILSVMTTTTFICIPLINSAQWRMFEYHWDILAIEKALWSSAIICNSLPLKSYQAQVNFLLIVTIPCNLIYHY